MKTVYEGGRALTTKTIKVTMCLSVKPSRQLNYDNDSKLKCSTSKAEGRMGQVGGKAGSIPET